MWFRNKKTKLEWEVTHKDTIKRLEKDPEYEKIDKNIQESEFDKADKKSSKADKQEKG